MSDQLFNTEAAAKVLSELLPDKTAEQWAGWLRNNRNTKRPAYYRVPFTQIGRPAYYSQEALETFAEFQKARQLGTMKLTGRAAEAMRAFGIGEASGSNTGRRMSILGITAQHDETTNKTFVQFAMNDPLMVFRLEPEEVRSMVEQLVEAFQDANRIQKIIDEGTKK